MNTGRSGLSVLVHQHVFGQSGYQSYLLFESPRPGSQDDTGRRLVDAVASPRLSLSG